jgi:hypothetical protein
MGQGLRGDALGIITAPCPMLLSNINSDEERRSRWGDRLGFE